MTLRLINTRLAPPQDLALSSLPTMSAKAISAAFTHFLQFRIQYSSLALLYYDFALTFPKEVEYMWKQRFRLSTALYICCRYALVANVLYLLAIAEKLGSTVRQCNFWYKIIGALSVLGRAAVIAVFCIRTHAVWGNNKWVLGYMGVVGLALTIAVLARRTYLARAVLDHQRCPSVHITLSCASIAYDGTPAPEMLSILMVIFESSSALLTTARCVVKFRAGGGIEQHRTGLMFMLFEQDATHISSTISIFTTAAIILNYPGFFQRLPNAFTLPLSCILTARLLLYLREWEDKSQGSKAHLSALDFGAAAESGGGTTGMSVGIDSSGEELVTDAEASRGSVELESDRQDNFEGTGDYEASDNSGDIFKKDHGVTRIKRICGYQRPDMFSAMNLAVSAEVKFFLIAGGPVSEIIT
ncbi:hypothetical protein GGX14DRAFT_466865 [Mycena pura]|uniref:DUF6533 domain-containing protein n=1 Tax=Mycena pura TaxID=153505 RepID=A0AAD6V110_9AGAR|nr:hypothetical protein GGX14DRAFT_466865 [Mycena pura]